MTEFMKNLKKHKYSTLTCVIFAAVLIIGFAQYSTAKAELYEGMNITWVNDNKVDCHNPNNYPSGQITWTANITNNNADSVYIEKAAFHSPKAGCTDTAENLRQDIFAVSGKTTFGSGQSGQTTFTYNTASMTCGRVQLDAAYRNSNGNGDGLVFFGEVINYGVDCPPNDPEIPQPCVDNAVLMASTMVPNKVTPGAAVPVGVQIFNTGSSWFYHGSYYQLHQRTNLSLNPPYGHLEPSLHTGQEQIKDFILTAPTQPGTYTLTFQMFHLAGTQLLNDQGQVCGAAPTSDKYFGTSLSITFEVTGQPVQQTGNIVVLSNIPTSWTVLGPSNYSGSGTYGSYQAPVGSYTITGLPTNINWGGTNYVFNTVNQSTQQLSLAGTVLFQVNYSQQVNVNPATITASSNQTCSNIKISWTDNSNNESGFYIYRSLTGGSNLSDYTRIAQLAANATSYTDQPPVNKSYYYIVSAYISNTSTQTNSQPYLSALNLPCTANIDGSIRISAVNGNTQFSINNIKDQDVITIEILVDNTGPSSGYISNITNQLSGQLVNARNLQATGPNIVLGNPRILGTGQSTTFNVSGRKNVGGDKWVITFDATVSVPGGQTIEQFGDCSTINYFDESGNKTKKFCLNQVLTAQQNNQKSGGIKFREVAP